MSVDPSTSTVVSSEPNKESIRGRVTEIIRRGFSSPEITLIEALPASGKSYGVLSWAAETGNQLTVFGPHHDLLDEYEGWCKQGDLDLSVTRLPSFHRDCKSVSLDKKGRPADELTEKLLARYRQGLKGEKIHEEASRLYGEDLPCQHDSQCPFIQKLSIEVEDYDVLLGHYLHAYQDDWTDDRYVAIDEFPGDAFVQEYTGKVAPAVTAYLREEDQLPFHDYDDLLTRGSDFPMEVEAWKDDLWQPYDSTHVLQSPASAAHALAPLMTMANLEKERLENRWQHADLGDGKVAARNTEHEWSFLLPPDFENAESVVALDGTPVTELWELVLGTEVNHLALFAHDQRQKYLEEVLELSIVQTTENWNAYQSGEGVAPTVDIPFVEKVGDIEGQKPGVISSKEALKQYKNHGIKSLVSKMENYGGLKGINSFGTLRSGVILGNPHPGDGVIEKWSALAGYSAKRKEGTEGEDTDYGFFGNRVMEAKIHNEVLQAVMRFGREECNGEKGATVYVHTSALPKWVEPEKRLVDIDSWITQKNGMIQVIGTIQSLDDWETREWKVSDVADQVDVSKRSAREHLKTLVDHGYLASRTAGQGGAYHFSNVRLEEAGEYGHVEFSE
ncbi:hypothetical protein GCM10008995_01590 [Halobellus salinus]|uniref:Uncharacterized protein n=1 Tax=Halobellus salinus TaxID=931585 RepID=A0A830EBU3_9EURY|nr:helix-turn-helix domain-containing protein [Halobellus salinus]GGI95123.1 hypothetical protein GCM10008995_01590 [Halobellus salinus]SMP20493.1 IclR helix-turn-helix domain-containing protein [Halobellus salinus]